MSILMGMVFKNIRYNGLKCSKEQYGKVSKSLAVWNEGLPLTEMEKMEGFYRCSFVQANKPAIWSCIHGSR